MGCVVAYVPDLLFGSQVLEAMRGAGHKTDLVGDEDALRAAAARHTPEVLIVDLTDDVPGRIELVGRIRADGLIDGARLLGFYSHVEVDTRTLADDADFDLVVPRSRMAREGAALVDGMLAS